MSKEKQIEEISTMLHVGRSLQLSYVEIAVRLYEAGYRKQSEGVTDINVGNKSEWISVEERLPNGNGSFLTVDEKGHMEVCYWEKRFGWFASSCNKNALTHWMPLPEAPKGGAEQ